MEDDVDYAAALALLRSASAALLPQPSLDPSLVSARPSLGSAATSLVSTGPSLDSAGPSLGSTGPSLVSTGPSLVSAGPSLVSAGPSLGSAAPSLGSARPSLGSAAPSLGSAGPSLGSAGPSLVSAAAAAAVDPPARPALEAVADWAWERIHRGVWTEVPRRWRALYADAAVAVARTCAQEDEAIAWLDKALLLGAPDDRDAVQRSLAALQARLRISGKGAPWRAEVTAAEQAAIAGLREALGGAPVARLEAPSLETFLERCLWPETPVVLEGCLDHWPALSTRPWSDLDYLCAVAGPRTVPIELGARYTDAAWTQTLVTFRDFVATHVVPRPPPAPDHAAGVSTPARPMAYLAQHELFEQVPALRDDIAVPDYCYVDVTAPAKRARLDGAAGDGGDDDGAHPVLMNAWFGPGGTVSPLHTDPHHNLLAQVVGYKYVKLYAPADTAHLYPHPDALLANTSQVDVEDAAATTQWPAFAHAHAQACVLGPGDLLYIPRGWWHYVRSLSTSFSVSFWFGGDHRV